jgi:hypothetical protein
MRRRLGPAQRSSIACLAEAAIHGFNGTIYMTGQFVSNRYNAGRLARPGLEGIANERRTSACHDRCQSNNSAGTMAFACFLPDEPYQPWQLAEPVFGGVYTNLRWAYERIHFDDRPANIEVVRASKTLLGISAARVEHQLAARGLTAHVANLSTNSCARSGKSGEDGAPAIF